MTLEPHRSHKQSLFSVSSLQQVLIFFGKEQIRYRRDSLCCFISTGLKNWIVTYDNGSVKDEVEIH